MSRPTVTRDRVIRLWLHRQQLARVGPRPLTRRAFVGLLESVGGLQLDSVNVLERAHYLTLWSRFGSYDRARVDRWCHRDRVAYEHWGHAASLLPAQHLPHSRREMRRFRMRGAWWGERKPAPAVFRRVLGRIRAEGPLESADFASAPGSTGPWWDWKADKVALEVLWRQGRLATHDRRHFRRVYDLAERVYPQTPTATPTEFEDGWLHLGLAANGVAPPRHLVNYLTAPHLTGPRQRQVIERNRRAGRVVEVDVEGEDEPWLARPADLEAMRRLPVPRGTTLICPFDSLLWQRQRAEDLLGFRYRVEIYVPPARRQFGYYAMPILHDGRLVGRVDPKLHRARGVLELRRIGLEPGVRRDRPLEAGLSTAIAELAHFCGARHIELPRGWKRLL